MNVSIPCPCPPKADGSQRHPNGDTVVLRDRLGFRDRTTLRQTVTWAKQVKPDLTDGEALALLQEAYLTTCIDSWTLTDEKNKPLPLTRAEVLDLIEEHDDVGLILGDEADTLYTAVVLLPLIKGASMSSDGSPIDASTSQTNGSGPKPPKRSKPSSISTTPMASTGPMLASPGGASN